MLLLGGQDLLPLRYRRPCRNIACRRAERRALLLLHRAEVLHGGIEVDIEEREEALGAGEIVPDKVLVTQLKVPVRIVDPEFAADVDMGDPRIVSLFEARPQFTVVMSPPEERGDDVPAIADHVHEPCLREHRRHHLETAVVVRVGIVWVLVTPERSVGLEPCVEVPHDVRKRRAQVTDELLPVRDHELIEVRKDVHRAMQPREDARLVADIDVRMLVEQLLDIRRPGTRRTEDDYRITPPRRRHRRERRGRRVRGGVTSDAGRSSFAGSGRALP